MRSAAYALDLVARWELGRAQLPGTGRGFAGQRPHRGVEPLVPGADAIHVRATRGKLHRVEGRGTQGSGFSTRSAPPSLPRSAG